MTFFVGIHGPRNTGKSTLAELIEADIRRRAPDLKVECVGMVDACKREAQILYGFTNEELWGPSHMREIFHPELGKTVRRALEDLAESQRADDEEHWAKSWVSHTTHLDIAISGSVRYEAEAWPTRAHGVLVHMSREEAYFRMDHPSDFPFPYRPDLGDQQVQNNDTKEALAVRAAAIAAQAITACRGSVGLRGLGHRL